MQPQIIIANYTDASHAKAIALLMRCYSGDPFGGGTMLSEAQSNNIAGELGKRDYAFSLLCYIDGEPVGLANCFESFSTFACKPVINIHDIVVVEHCRGQGLSHALLTAVEDIAKQRGCAKLTLEVLSNNHVAKASYKKFGFSDYILNPEHGHALFWQKKL
jgi:ribosomal protein S18 acetylase RimI-like enzyme